MRRQPKGTSAGGQFAGGDARRDNVGQVYDPAPTAGDFDDTAFDDRFTAIDSPQGSGMWEHDEVTAAIESGQVDEAQVWTVVDGDDGSTWATPGFHTVNNIGYTVTEEPTSEEDVLYSPSLEYAN